MMAIGLNPSKANEEKLDPTSRNIEKIANNTVLNFLKFVFLFFQPKISPTIFFCHSSNKNGLPANSPFVCVQNVSIKLIDFLAAKSAYKTLLSLAVKLILKSYFLKIFLLYMASKT